MNPTEVAALLRRVSQQPGLVARFNAAVTSPPSRSLDVFANSEAAIAVTASAPPPWVEFAGNIVLSMPCVVTVANSDDLYDRMVGCYEASREDAVLDAVDGEGP